MYDIISGIIKAIIDGILKKPLGPLTGPDQMPDIVLVTDKPEPVIVDPPKPLKPGTRMITPYEWALNELKTQDTKEIPGSKDNPRIVWYHSFTSLKATDDETPWCSAFMCCAAAQTGRPHTKSAAAKSWKTFGVEGTGAVGDIAVFSRDGGNHVAFLHKPYKKGDSTLTVLGGNQGNKLSIDTRSSSRLLAIRKFKEY